MTKRCIIVHCKIFSVFYTMWQIAFQSSLPVYACLLQPSRIIVDVSLL